MLLAIIIAIFVGLFAGTLSGLTPGIHINLVSTILLAVSATLLELTSPIILIVFIISMAITHTFVDFIPSILLGAPDEDSVLSVLPGHQLLLKGEGYNAIVLTLIGCLIGLIIILIFTPMFILFLPRIYPYITRIMPIILILISGFLILSEEKNKLLAFIIFLLAGFLGIASLNLNLKESLLPLLTGLFGASGLIVSIKQKTKIPKQKIDKIINIIPNKKSLGKTVIASLLASPFTAFLPGLGSSQSAVIGKYIIKDLDEKEFLFLIGAINIIVMGLSFITLYTIQKTRTGAAVAVSKLIPNLTFNNVIIILSVIILSGICAFFISISISKFISNKIHKIEYTKVSYIILGILVFFVFIFSGPLGFIVFIVSTSLGITTILLGIKRMYLMGCLLVPTILFYVI
jgi:putative membrane protein